MTEFETTMQFTNEQLEKYIREIGECGNEILRKLSEQEQLGKVQIAKYLFYLDNHDKLADPPKLDLKPGVGAVIRKPDIESLCDKKEPLPLIDPFDPYRLETASYQLRLGSRYRVGKAPEWLTDSKPALTIPSHDIALVSTYEWLNIPGYLIGRWNLKVKMVYRGLVWVGSLQVDPGYQGFLFCPLYNLSDQPQVLVYKQPLFIIDFVLTTPATRYGLWGGPRYSTFDFDRLDAKTRSAPASSFDKMWVDISKMKAEADEFNVKLGSRIESLQDRVIVLIGILVAALAIISGFGLGSVKWYSNWIPFVVAVFALAVSCVALYISIAKTRKNARPIRKDSSGPPNATASADKPPESKE
jgi:deoxycytidine triphosphate deaminase